MIFMDKSHKSYASTKLPKIDLTICGIKLSLKFCFFRITILM